MRLLMFATLLGAIAGLASWALMEPSNPGLGSPMAWMRWENGFVAILGALIGGAIGGLNGWYQGSRTHLIRGALVGIVAGSVGGILGMGFGGTLSQIVTNGRSISGLPAPLSTVARTLAFIPIGAMIGAVIGASGLSWRRTWVGALGGAVGGLISGLAFDPVAGALKGILIASKGGLPGFEPGGIPRVSAEIGGPSRAVFAVLLGGSIGLFTALFARLTRSAWIRLVLGRNEGKEWLVDAQQTFIGRSERAHVPLMGDMNVAPMHACIQKSGMNYLLVDGGSPIGTFVNGQRVAQCPLFDGAVIQVGPYQLVFSLRGEAAKRAGEAAYASSGQRASAQPYAPQPPSPTSQFPQSPMGATQVVSAVAAQQSPAVSNRTSIQTASAATALVALDGPMAGQRFPLVAGMEVGREGGTIPLSFDSSVSRRHAKFVQVAGEWEVADQGSTNGTYVNGQRTDQKTIRPGDVVKIGATSFRVE